jgi:hypothetical protein
MSPGPAASVAKRRGITADAVEHVDPRPSQLTHARDYGPVAVIYYVVAAARARARSRL